MRRSTNPIRSRSGARTSRRSARSASIRTRARSSGRTRCSELVAALRRADRRGARRPSAIETRTAGRILAIRSFGKANFLAISDGESQIQVYIRQDSVSERDFSIFKLLDFGDFVGVEGNLFRTKTNELTIHVVEARVPGQVLPAAARRSGTA